MIDPSRVKKITSIDSLVTANEEFKLSPGESYEQVFRIKITNNNNANDND